MIVVLDIKGNGGALVISGGRTAQTIAETFAVTSVRRVGATVTVVADLISATEHESAVITGEARQWGSWASIVGELQFRSPARPHREKLSISLAKWPDGVFDAIPVFQRAAEAALERYGKQQAPPADAKNNDVRRDGGAK